MKTITVITLLFLPSTLVAVSPAALNCLTCIQPVLTFAEPNGIDNLRRQHLHHPRRPKLDGVSCRGRVRHGARVRRVGPLATGDHDSEPRRTVAVGRGMRAPGVAALEALQASRCGQLVPIATGTTVAGRMTLVWEAPESRAVFGRLRAEE